MLKKYKGCEKMKINGNWECEHRRKIISGLGGCLCNKENCYKVRRHKWMSK